MAAATKATTSADRIIFFPPEPEATATMADRSRRSVQTGENCYTGAFASHSDAVACHSAKPQRGPCGVMQVGIITRHTNLSSQQVRERAGLGGHPGRSWFGVMLRAVKGRPRYAGRPPIS